MKDILYKDDPRNIQQRKGALEECKIHLTSDMQDDDTEFRCHCECLPGSRGCHIEHIIHAAPFYFLIHMQPMAAG